MYIFPSCYGVLISCSSFRCLVGLFRSSGSQSNAFNSKSSCVNIYRFHFGLEHGVPDNQNCFYGETWKEEALQIQSSLLLKWPNQLKHFPIFHQMEQLFQFFKTSMFLWRLCWCQLPFCKWYAFLRRPRVMKKRENFLGICFSKYTVSTLHFLLVSPIKRRTVNSSQGKKVAIKSHVKKVTR